MNVCMGGSDLCHPQGPLGWHLWRFLALQVCTLARICFLKKQLIDTYYINVLDLFIESIHFVLTSEYH